MANDNGRLPKSVAERLCADHKLSQVVIIARTQCGTQVCTTHGITSKDRENADLAGRVWERVIQIGQTKGAQALANFLRDLR